MKRFMITSLAALAVGASAFAAPASALPVAQQAGVSASDSVVQVKMTRKQMMMHKKMMMKKKMMKKKM